MTDYADLYDSPRPTSADIAVEGSEAREKISAATRVASLVVDIHTIGDAELVLGAQPDEALYRLVADMGMLQDERFDVEGAYALTQVQFSELYALADTLAAARLGEAGLTETPS